MSVRQRVLHALLSRGKEDLRREDPQVLASILIGHIASVVGAIPPEVWEAMRQRTETPCVEPGCNCQDVVKKAWPALEAIRADYREQITTRGLS
jgi:hypothetical protein